MAKTGRILGEALGSIFKKPATGNYPFVPADGYSAFRGKIAFFPEKCIGCKLCVKDCPSAAITIVKIGEKQFEAIIELDKCLYCAQCVDSCPKKALEISAAFELASLDRKTLRVNINVKDSPITTTVYVPPAVAAPAPAVAAPANPGPAPVTPVPESPVPEKKD